MDKYIKGIIHQVVKDYTDAEIIRDHDSKNIETTILTAMHEQPYTVKMTAVNLDNQQKKEIAKGEKPNCNYKIISQNGKSTKLCKRIVKNKFQLRCEAHAILDQGAGPETFLKTRFNDMFTKQCNDVTYLFRDNSECSPLLKSKQTTYKVYIIRSVRVNIDAIFYSYYSMETAWHNGIICLISDNETSFSGDSLEEVCEQFKIAPAHPTDVTLFQTELRKVKLPRGENINTTSDTETIKGE